MKKLLHTTFILIISLFHPVKGQQVYEINPRILEHFWDSYWISHPDVPGKEYGVFHFRKTFTLENIYDNFIIHVSGDNRYRLFVNGNPVAMGPARGDLNHWRFESLDIAPHLKKGKNTIAALVWNFGAYIPAAQITLRTAFILQGNTEKEHIVNTNETWKVFHNKGYRPEIESFKELQTYIVVGPGDKLDGNAFPWGWEKPEYDDTDWIQPERISVGMPRGTGTGSNWMLVPRKIPFMDKEQIRFDRIARQKVLKEKATFISGKNPLTIPANEEVAFLLDQGYLVMGYPELIISGGRNSLVTITYSESLFNKDGSKGNRDSIEHKEIKGYKDYFVPDGGKRRLFRPLWLRTYRYCQITIKTRDEPLTVVDYYGMYSSYPFQENAFFKSNEKYLENIWEVGWRTARLCAGETYYDCPYYEQLQYAGDTRIQALISLYVSGDDRLMKKAITDFHDSMLPMGLTQSRYPSSVVQIIPPYSLLWIAMIYDYWMHRDDADYIRNLLPGIEGVLEWFHNHLKENNMLGPMPWWHFVDWAKEWPWNPEKGGGVPKGVAEGKSSIINLQYVYVLNMASQLFSAFDKVNLSERYMGLAKKIKTSIYSLCWDREKGIIGDTPDKKTFSQHANILAVLTNTIPQKDQKKVLVQTLNDTTLIQTTFYFKFYLFRALKKAEMGDQYISLLNPWKDMLDNGLTTFAETPDPTRSDCHAWSASPNYDLLSIVAGIEPAEPGFKSIKIEPYLGKLNNIEVKMPHPEGFITIKLSRTGKNGIQGNVVFPESMEGSFHWKGTTLHLKGGENIIDL